MSRKTNRQLLDEWRTSLQESVEYFSSKNKPERELWVCENFLTNLGVRFNTDEVSHVMTDPPDVVFRTAAFEIKELLDPERQRHAELKVELKRANKAKHPKEMMGAYIPKDIIPGEIAIRIQPILETYFTHYARSVRASMGLLIYANLLEHHLKVGRMPNPETLISYGWRSISVLIGSHALVLSAPRGAPKFLRNRESGIFRLRTRRVQ